MEWITLLVISLIALGAAGVAVILVKQRSRLQAQLRDVQPRTGRSVTRGRRWRS